MQLKKLAGRFKGRFIFTNRFDEPLAHRLYGGGDLFLMPSLFEPCGLGQMIAMRYGSIPLAADTGGLSNTVKDSSKKNPTGLLFARNSSQGMIEGLKGGLEILETKNEAVYRKNSMNEDFSWNNSVEKYVKIYRRGLSDYEKDY